MQYVSRLRTCCEVSSRYHGHLPAAGLTRGRHAGHFALRKADLAIIIYHTDLSSETSTWVGE